MKQQLERSNLFRKSHVKGEPLILFNIWDVASAKCVEEPVAKAVATSNYSIAAANGYDDGRYSHILCSG